MKSPLPKGILLDLDDTILDGSGTIEACWRYACHACQPEAAVGPETLYQAIERTRQSFWSDPERHRVGRLDLLAAARTIVAQALTEVSVPNPELAATIAATYGRKRVELLEPFPDAIDTVRWLREQGCRLALVTNGAASMQRDKVTRFGLTDLFDWIGIEGELGFGKPDPRVYTRALQELGVTAADAWMVGDHIEFDVDHPQRMGITGIWIDAAGAGLPAGSPVRPDRIVRRLSDLRA